MKYLGIGTVIMEEIIVYDKSGKIHDKVSYNLDNLGRTSGMMMRCTLKSGNTMEGFADPYRLHDGSCNMKIGNFIYLSRWAYLNEETGELYADGDDKYKQVYEKVLLDDVIKIEVIRYSGPRWGGKLTNKFSLDNER